MKLQGDVGIEAQAEVVVEDIQGQLEKGQGPRMRAGPNRPPPGSGMIQARGHQAHLAHAFWKPFPQLRGSTTEFFLQPVACPRLCPLRSRLQ